MPNKLPLDPAELPAEPLVLVRRWLDDAAAQGMRDPGAMALATAGADGRPSVRMVLLRGLDEKGFRFHTNRLSLKGRQLAENPRAQLLFYWRDMNRQIFVHGDVEELSDAESDAYFATRPRGARLGAIASEQGAVISGRDELAERWAAADAAYPGEEIPRPDYWGGYMVIPEAIEFWEAHELRLHDRYVYVRETGGGWRVERLSP